MATRPPSPKSEKPEFVVTDTEEESQTLCPPPQGATSKLTRPRKGASASPKINVEVDLSTLLKFIKPYDGSREKLNSFLVNCNNAYELASESQKDILFKYILCQLEGKAETACSIKEFTNWQQLKDFLKVQFSERKHYAHLLTDLQECKQLPNENVSQYALRIETCLSQLLTEISISHGHKPKEMLGRTAGMEELALHHFQMGLTSRLSNIIRCKSPKTLNEAINMAISEEKIQQSLFRQNQTIQQQPRQFRSNVQRPIQRNQNQNMSPNANQFNSRFNTNMQNRPNFNNSSNIFCRYCKAQGHTLEQCRKREYNNNRFKNFEPHQTQPRTPYRVNFVSDDVPENDTEFDESGDHPQEGYDTVDHESKNE